MSGNSKQAPTENPAEQSDFSEGREGATATSGTAGVQEGSANPRQASPAAPPPGNEPEQAADEPGEPSAGVVSEEAKRIPTSESMRKFLRKVLPTDPRLSAFCIDKFPVIYGQFSEGMNRETKLNIILEASETHELLTKITEYSPFEAHEHMSIVRYEILPQTKEMQQSGVAINQSNQFLYDAFLSYNSHDEGFARSIAELLRRRGFRVWYEADSVTVGESLEQARVEAIHRSRIVVVLVGENWRSPWQALSVREQTKAILADPSRQRLIPVLLPGAPKTDRPVLLQPLRALDFRQNYEELILAVGEGKRLPWRTIAATGGAIAMILVILYSPIHFGETTDYGPQLAALTQKYESEISRSEQTRQQTERQLADTKSSLEKAEQSRQQSEQSLSKVRAAASSGKPAAEVLSEVRKAVAPPASTPPSQPDGGINDEVPDGGIKSKPDGGEHARLNRLEKGIYTINIKLPKTCIENLHIYPFDKHGYLLQFRRLLLRNRIDCTGQWQLFNKEYYPVQSRSFLDRLTNLTYRCVRESGDLEIHFDIYAMENLRDDERWMKFLERRDDPIERWPAAHFHTKDGICEGRLVVKLGNRLIGERAIPSRTEPY